MSSEVLVEEGERTERVNEISNFRLEVYREVWKDSGKTGHYVCEFEWMFSRFQLKRMYLSDLLRDLAKILLVLTEVSEG